MELFLKKRAKKAGLPPGSLVHVGTPKMDKVRITVTEYNESRLREEVVQEADTCFPSEDPGIVTWIDVVGLHDTETIGKIGHNFGLHPLVMEDVLNTAQRSKIEEYDGSMFVVLKVYYVDEHTHEVTAEQVSLVFNGGTVLSFQEGDPDVFQPIRKRLQKSNGRLRTMKSDYLAYSLIDAVVDHYFVVLESLGGWIESVEEALMLDPSMDTMQEIHQLRRTILFLRKSVWPMREFAADLERSDSPAIRDTTRHYLRDLSDHSVQLVDITETFRDMIASMQDIYLSTVSNRMNEVMKVLTIFASIFIPLTFLAGMYGMNFKYMPELEWRWSYPVLWGIVLVTGACMLIYFKRKRWL